MTYNQASQSLLVGSGRKAERLKKEISRVAPYSCSVLIQGETGTGKELVARSIHEESNRQSLLTLCCNAIPDSLVESQLFGHERGAFTGAVKQRKGIIERAHKGTLFLDEVGLASAHLQERLLRVLETRNYERIGSYYVSSSDFRLVAASNIDLMRAVEAKEFREDLFYRLNTVTIEVQPLRKRTEDITDLAEHFIKQYQEAYRKSDLRLSETARDMLVDYCWPGNVRELQHTIERAVINSNGCIQARDLALPGPVQPISSNGKLSLPEAVAEFECGYLHRALQKENGQVSRTARELGIHRKTLYDKAALYGLDVKKYRD